MSLVATVYCRCLEEGKAKPLPFDAALLSIQPNGKLSLLVTEEQEHQRLKGELAEWEKFCCEHPWRYDFNEWIGSWQSINALRSALKDIGTEFFPTLLEVLPQLNSGEVTTEQSAAALRELVLFREKLAEGAFQLAKLIDQESNSVLIAMGAQAQRCIYFSDGIEFWLNEGKFQILEKPTEKILFDSTHFTQRLEGDAGQAETLFTDEGGGTVVKIPNDQRVMDVRVPEAVPVTMAVELQACEVDEFDFVVLPLTKAFEASVKMARPIIWG